MKRTLRRRVQMGSGTLTSGGVWVDRAGIFGLVDVNTTIDI